MTDIIITCNALGVPKVITGRDKEGNPVKKTLSSLAQRGQRLTLPEQDAERLIALGLAAPVSAAPVNTANSADEGEPDPGQTPDTPDPDKEQEPEDDDPAADGAEIEGEEDEVDLSELTVAELKELCADAGIDLKGLTSKAKLIAAYEAQALPEITAEDPV